MARLLLEKGANIDIVDRNGWMVCETAVEKGHIKVLKIHVPKILPNYAFNNFV